MNAPVLVIGFNRPERLDVALKAVREARAPVVYIAIDGPRNADEAKLVGECRAVAESVDWAPVRTSFQERNLGCQRGVIDAVSWFFTHEDRGVIVEDDSVPDQSFFPFCDELLERYADDHRVLAIAGESRVPAAVVSPEFSYRFSHMGPAGAWATWRDRWLSFVSSRIDRRPLRLLTALGHGDYAAPWLRLHWSALSLANRTSAMDSWAYPFMLEGIVNHRLTATPNINLVDDQGVGDAASHMLDGDALAQPHGALDFPLRHPEDVALDEAAEAWSIRNEVSSGPAHLVQSGTRFLRRLAR